MLKTTTARAPEAAARRLVEQARRRSAGASPTPAPQSIRIQRMRHLPGFLHGLRAPSVEAQLAITSWSGWMQIANQGLALLEARLPAPVAPEALVAAAGRRSATLDVVQRLVRVMTGLQQVAGMPHLGEPWLEARAVRKGAASARLTEEWLLALPSLAPAAMADALIWVVQWLERRDPGSPWSSRDSEEFSALQERISRSTSRGFNNRYLLEAAHRLDIPWMALPGGIIQYGWGSNGTWMESTFTQFTSSISSKAARNKAITAALLRQAGLPAPAHRIVRTADAAVEAATALGYPVVVKPLDQDGGVGVSAGLQDEAQVRSAVERARAHAENLLVEKHVDGRDFRVYVFRGRAVGAMERVPGGVTGDGVHTVRQLVDETNKDPRRGDASWSVLTRLVLDAEAQELLGLAGLDADSVPEAGRFVRLRRASNVSSGGMPVEAFAGMHRDNLRLCERAAEALRLDLAGVDLIIPDPARSWRETGAGICELNAQPQLSAVATSHLFPQVLTQLVPARGRLPVALVVGDAEKGSALVKAGAALLARRGVRAGTLGESGLHAGDECLSPTRGPLLADVRSLVMDRGVQALIVHAGARDLMAGGFPFDRFDLLVVADDVAPDAPEAVAEMQALIEAAALHGQGGALLFRDHPAVPAAREAFGAQRVRLVGSAAALPAAIDAALRAAAE